MCNSKFFLKGGGGFSNLCGSVVSWRKNNVLDPYELIKL